MPGKKKTHHYEVHYTGPEGYYYEPGKVSGPHKTMEEAYKEEKALRSQGEFRSRDFGIKRIGYKDGHDKLARKKPTHED